MGKGACTSRFYNSHHSRSDCARQGLDRNWERSRISTPDRGVEAKSSAFGRRCVSEEKCSMHDTHKTAVHILHRFGFPLQTRNCYEQCLCHIMTVSHREDIPCEPIRQPNCEPHQNTPRLSLFHKRNPCSVNAAARIDPLHAPNRTLRLTIIDRRQGYDLTEASPRCCRCHCVDGQPLGPGFVAKQSS